MVDLTIKTDRQRGSCTFDRRRNGARRNSQKYSISVIFASVHSPIANTISTISILPNPIASKRKE